eukprot:4021232-Pyramimonas_sp.AAC.1
MPEAILMRNQLRDEVIELLHAPRQERSRLELSTDPILDPAPVPLDPPILPRRVGITHVMTYTPLFGASGESSSELGAAVGN